MDYRIECYHHGADCLKFIHRYYLKTLGGPLQLVVVLVSIFFILKIASPIPIARGQQVQRQKVLKAELHGV